MQKAKETIHPSAASAQPRPSCLGTLACLVNNFVVTFAYTARTTSHKNDSHEYRHEEDDALLNGDKSAHGQIRRVVGVQGNGKAPEIHVREGIPPRALREYGRSGSSYSA